MNPERFFIPGYMGMRGVPIPNSNFGLVNSFGRGGGLFSKITSGIRSVNWGGILNGTSKTLNVVNQAIPLVKQAGPMVNNMRSMLKIARAFGSETGNKRNAFGKNNNHSVNNSHTFNNGAGNIVSSDNRKKEIQSDESPNFFI